jgi:hypothetical protein
MTESVLLNGLAWAKHGHASFPLWWPVTRDDRTACACGEPCGKQAAKHPVASVTRGNRLIFLAPRGHLSATTNTGVLKHWFGYLAPQANLGISTEKLVVVDVDPRHGGDESLKNLEAEHGELPLTWRSLTGGGGEHIIFAAPVGAEIYNVKAEGMTDPPLGPGIDVRARGGYIVGVGSTHISGRRYEWSVDHHPADVPLAPVPDWLAERLTACDTATSPNGGSAEPIPSDVWSQLTRRPIIEYPDEVAARIVGHLFRHSCDYELVLGLLHAWNTTWCKPPLDDDELKDIVDRIALREANRIRAQLKRDRGE